MAGGVSLPIVFGAVLAGAVVIDYGFKSAGSAFANAGTAGGGGVSPNAQGFVAPVDPKVAHVGRTDQGVDISAPAGTKIRAIGDSKVMGIIPNWYNGQPYIWFELLDGSQRYWYAAEQLIPNVRLGQIVRAGDPVATVASSGTGLELGWATKDGATLAHATGGYVEGQATRAGQDFARFLQGLGL